jgi:hypothetical protein
MIRTAMLSVRRSQWGTLPLRELLIDGRSIQETFAKFTRKRSAMLETSVSPLAWLDAAGSQISLTRFLPDGPADFPNGHRAILVCRECGDFGCGALTARIEVDNDAIVWRDWLWQVNYDDSQRDNFGNLIPGFAFHREQYLAALQAALA